MRKVAAGLVLVWLLAGVAIELGSYLPIDPEWTLLSTATLFGTTFLVGSLGAFFMAPELVRIREWPTQLQVAHMAWDRLAPLHSGVVCDPIDAPRGAHPLWNSGFTDLRLHLCLQQPRIVDSDGPCGLSRRRAYSGSRLRKPSRSGAVAHLDCL